MCFLFFQDPIFPNHWTDLDICRLKILEKPISSATDHFGLLIFNGIGIPGRLKREFVDLDFSDLDQINHLLDVLEGDLWERWSSQVALRLCLGFLSILSLHMSKSVKWCGSIATQEMRKHDRNYSHLYILFFYHGNNCK